MRIDFDLENKELIVGEYRLGYHLLRSFIEEVELGEYDEKPLVSIIEKTSIQEVEEESNHIVETKEEVIDYLDINLNNLWGIFISKREDLLDNVYTIQELPEDILTTLQKLILRACDKHSLPIEDELIEWKPDDPIHEIIIRVFSNNKGLRDYRSTLKTFNILEDVKGDKPVILRESFEELKKRKRKYQPPKNKIFEEAMNKAMKDKKK